MTKLSYDIYLNGSKIKNVTSYTEAVETVKESGRGWSYKAVYTKFNPEDTPEKEEAFRKYREKLVAKRALN